MSGKEMNRGRFTPERAREAQKESARARRAHSLVRKTAKEFAEAALNAEIVNKTTGKKIVAKDAVIQKIVAKAIQGDLKCAKYLFELINENPTHRIELNGELRNAFKVIVKDEAEKKLVEGISEL